MALTRDFKETIMERAAHDEQYRKGLLAEAVNEMLEGNLDVGKAMLRDYIKATITFPALAQKLNKSSKSIHRMLALDFQSYVTFLVTDNRLLLTDHGISCFSHPSS